MIANAIGDIDVPSSFKINHMDKRWSGNPAPMTSYLYPGCGFGGYCLPKDVQALYAESVNKGYMPVIVKNILEVNRKIKEFAVKKVLASIDKGEYIGVLGLSFKPESDDIRETPSKDIIKMLLEEGYSKIIAYDPLANDNFKNTYNLPIKYAYNIEEIFSNCDSIIVLTAWDEFKKYKRQLAGKNVLDFRYYL
jgi:UDPglucose 6-dehydrogenase